MIAVLSTLNSWESSTKNIFAAVKTPCANTPLLSALNLFLSKTLPIQFLRRCHLTRGGINYGKDAYNIETSFFWSASEV